MNVLFHPRAGRGYFCCQWRGLGGFLGVAPIVEPAQFNEAFIGDFARHVVERIAQEMHIVRQPPDRIRFGNYFGDPTLKSRMIVADREEDAA